MISFIFWMILSGLIIASIQDFKRREIDNWLNLLIIFSGFGFIFLKSILESDSDIALLGVVCFILMFCFANLFYYSRIFAGGDAKLMIAIFSLFVGVNFSETFFNISVYILLLLISGSFYGIVYSFTLMFVNFKKTKEAMKKEFSKTYFRYLVLIGFILIVLGYFNLIFLFLGFFILIGSILWVFAKAIERTAMIKYVDGKRLTEGDWLAENVRVKGRVINAEWEGLTKRDLELLKNKKKVKIKQGLPFSFSFLIAFLIYTLAREEILNLFNLLI